VGWALWIKNIFYSEFEPHSLLELCVIACVSEGFDTAVVWLRSGCSCFDKHIACIFRVQDESQFELELFFMCTRSEVSVASHKHCTVLDSVWFGLVYMRLATVRRNLLRHCATNAIAAFDGQSQVVLYTRETS